MIVTETYLYISNFRGVIWEKPRNWFGNKVERAKLVQHIKHHAKQLPITVEVTRIAKCRKQSLKVMKIEGEDRIVLAYKHFRISVKMTDMIPSIQEWVKNNDLINKEKQPFFYYTL